MNENFVRAQAVKIHLTVRQQFQLERSNEGVCDVINTDGRLLALNYRF